MAETMISLGNTEFKIDKISHAYHAAMECSNLFCLNSIQSM